MITQIIYKSVSAEQLELLASFGERFEPRFIEMTRDTSVTVACEALKLLQVLFDRQVIADYDAKMAQLLPLMRAQEASLWRALAPLLQRYVAHVVSEIGSQTKKKVS